LNIIYKLPPILALDIQYVIWLSLLTYPTTRNYRLAKCLLWTSREIHRGKSTKANAEWVVPWFCLQPVKT